MLFKTLGLTAALLSACVSATLQIVPGATWTAVSIPLSSFLTFFYFQLLAH